MLLSTQSALPPPMPATWQGASRAGRAAHPASALRVTPRHLLASARLCGAEASSAGQSGPVAGAWLLRAACQEAQSWRMDMAAPALAVTVALPPMSARAGTLVAQAEAALRISGLPGALLDMAFNEADLGDAGPDMMLLISALRDLGAGVALDGLACGSASLRTLRRLPVTALRLPHQLVQGLGTCADARALARGAIRAAHGLGAAAVALGVENALQRDILADLGCDSAQGGMFGHRLAPDHFKAALLS